MCANIVQFRMDPSVEESDAGQRDWIETANDMLETEIIQTFTSKESPPALSEPVSRPKRSTKVTRNSHGGFTCSLCQLMFATRHSVRRHAVKEHGDANVAVNPFDVSSYTCDIGDPAGDFWANADVGDGSNYSSGASARSKSRPLTVRCLEPRCDGMFFQRAVLREHLHLVHGFTFTDEYFEFDNESDYKSWRNRVETERRIVFVRRSKRRIVKDQLDQEFAVERLICNRSGKTRLINKNRQRLTKKVGSVKSNAICTAYMNATTNLKTGHISVVVCFDHYGHPVEMKSVRIPREDRIRIAEELKRGTSMEAIIEDCRNLAASDPAFYKLSQITRPHIHNIIRDFGLHEYVTVGEGGKPKICPVAESRVRRFQESQQRKKRLGVGSSLDDQSSSMHLDTNQSATPTPAFSCGKCGVQFRKEKNLHSHLELFHQVKLEPADYAGEVEIANNAND